ncbi:hypothetical protein NQ176_g2100 [Zarea fungicola]|uniref:Uncharacterized protein n=1 Tax=Zarea fungicola TaxID=93591 RepID=A0ACC1NPP5_9HYPO|nr:hypothetical protein NQ176_g2100 [Lecanicillium fungicola]
MAVFRILTLLTTALTLVSAVPTVPAVEFVEPTETFNLTKREYADGEGTYIDSDSGHRYASGVKCWTDYFIVSQSAYKGPWYPASGKVYCSGTSACQVSKMSGTQNCETWSLSITAGVESKIFKFGITAGYALQNCNSASDTTSCTWSDKQCHIVWAQQQYLQQNGYARRRCHDKGRDYTAWMQDFTHTAPTSTVNYGCGSKCSDSP